MDNKESAQLHYQLGDISASLRALEADIREQKKAHEETLKRLQEVEGILLQAKGSWKTLLMVAGFSSFLTGIIVKFSGLFLSR